MAAVEDHYHGMNNLKNKISTITKTTSQAMYLNRSSAVVSVMDR